MGWNGFAVPPCEKGENDAVRRKCNATHPKPHLAACRCGRFYCGYELHERRIGSFFHVLNDLERVADHIVNVGYSICNPTGDDNETIS